MRKVTLAAVGAMVLLVGSAAYVAVYTDLLHQPAPGKCGALQRIHRVQRVLCGLAAADPGQRRRSVAAAFEEDAWWIKAHALRALAEVEMTGDDLRYLRRALQHREQRLRLAAVRVLGRLGARGVPLLLRALRDGGELVRSDAARRLAALGPAAAPAAAELSHTLSGLLAAARARPRTMKGRGLALQLIAALGAMGPRVARAAVPALVEALDHPREARLRCDPGPCTSVAGEAARALVAMAPAAIPALRRALGEHAQEIVDAVVRAGRARLPLLERLVRDQPAAAQRRVVSAMGQLDCRALLFLRALGADRRLQLGAEIQRALAAVQQRTARLSRRDLRRWRAGASNRLKRRVAERVGCVAPAWAQLARAALTDKDTAVVRRAVRSFERFGPPVALGQGISPRAKAKQILAALP